jgi:hypothetical protein
MLHCKRVFYEVNLINSNFIFGPSSLDVMSRRGRGRFFQGDFEDMCTKKIHWCQTGVEQRVEHAQTLKRGPQSAPAEFFLVFHNNLGPKVVPIEKKTLKKALG